MKVYFVYISVIKLIYYQKIRGKDRTVAVIKTAMTVIVSAFVQK